MQQLQSIFKGTPQQLFSRAQTLKHVTLEFPHDVPPYKLLSKLTLHGKSAKSTQLAHQTYLPFCIFHCLLIMLPSQLVHIGPLDPGSAVSNKKSHPHQERNKLWEINTTKYYFFSKGNSCIIPFIPLGLTAQDETLDHRNDAILAWMHLLPMPYRVSWHGSLPAYEDEEQNIIHSTQHLPEKLIYGLSHSKIQDTLPEQEILTPLCIFYPPMQLDLC